MKDNTQLLIPDKVKVGFQTRGDTYTGQLAYIVYYDHKGVLRKKTSWEGWRDKKIEPVEIENVPTEGFVLNKKVGGYKSHWNFRDAHVRVYDPRNFEFEISVPNLLFILTQCDCSRGKGLEGKFVYAWQGQELVLLPASSEEYTKSKDFTKLQESNVKIKEMIPGATYVTKQQEELVYLGRFDYYFMTSYGGWRPTAAKYSKGVIKRHIFWNQEGEKLTSFDTLKNVGACKSETVVSNYAELVDKYNKSPHGSRAVRLFLKPTKDKVKDRYDIVNENWYFEESPGVFAECSTQYNWKDKDSIDYVAVRSRYTINNGVFTVNTPNSGMMRPPNKSAGYNSGYTRMEWREPTEDRLYVELENGTKLRMTSYYDFEKGQ